MPQPFKIQIKLGQFEFNAEGEESSVKEQLAQFMAFVNKAPSPAAPLKPPAGPPANGHGDETPPVVLSGDLEKIFVKDRESLTLRIHPGSGNRAQQGREALVLILYGYKCVFGHEDFGTMDITEALRKSGVTFTRVAELAGPLCDDGMMTKTGQLKGTRYRLTNKGVQMAEEIVKALKAKF